LDCAPGTRRLYLSRVRGLIRWMLRKGGLPRDPFGDLEPLRVPRGVDRALSADQVAQRPRVLPDARAEAIVWLMVGCGLRCIEVARLEVGDYDRFARYLHRVVGKGGHVRQIPVPEEV